MSRKAERIGRLQGCTTFKDLRDGLARSGVRVLPDLADTDIAHALGAIREGRDDVSPEVLEMFYGRVSLHKERVKASLRARVQWGDGSDKHESVRRFGIEFACSELLGHHIGPPTVRWVADLLVCRPSMVEAAQRAASALLAEDLDRGTQRFLRILTPADRAAA